MPREIADALQGRFDGLFNQVARELLERKGRPLVEVSGRLEGQTTRLGWMVDDLADAARGSISINRGVGLLLPRQPFNTKEERLLRVMGLTAAKEGDAAAGLCVTPDARFTFELADSVQTGVTLEQTPIELKLTLSPHAGDEQTVRLKGTVGQWDATRAEAVKWLSAQLGKLAVRPRRPARRTP